MKIVSLDAIPVSVPYRLRETSAIIDRGGVSDVIVKLVTDTGLVGWGEACKATDTLALEHGIRACTPLVLGRDPWEHEAILADIYKRGLWYLQPMFGNSILAGIDMALWDLCGKDCGQPLYKMLGGARRPSVNYAHYVRWDTDPATVAEHAREGVERGYTVFYMKAGVDEAVEERTLETVRGIIGPARKIRIDCNQAWSVPTAIRLINRWHGNHYALSGLFNRFDNSRLNVNGGSIALGHPIGCTGTRITTTLLHEMEKRSAKFGLATLCVSGGMGFALLVERV